MNKVAIYPPQVGIAKKILHFAYIFVPFVAGLDKFFYYLTDWSRYLAPEIPRTLGVGSDTFMLWVGIAEIALALLTAASPRIGGRLIALWLWLIIMNLALIPGFYDIMLRDFGLSLGALALARLATARKESDAE